MSFTELSSGGCFPKCGALTGNFLGGTTEVAQKWAGNSPPKEGISLKNAVSGGKCFAEILSEGHAVFSEGPIPGVRGLENAHTQSVEEFPKLYLESTGKAVPPGRRYGLHQQRWSPRG